MTAVDGMSPGRRVLLVVVLLVLAVTAFRTGWELAGLWLLR